MNGFEIPAAPVEIIVFATLAAMAVGGAVAVVVSRDPFMSAIALVLHFVALGGLYITLNSPFLGLAQIVIYAGAVVVLFLFVIAYLGDRREVLGGAHRGSWVGLAGIGGAVLLFGVLASVFVAADMPDLPAAGQATDTAYPFGSPHAIGDVFLTRYLLQFEATSLVLLVAAIGGIALGLTGRARHRRLRATLGTRSSLQVRRELELEQARRQHPRRHPEAVGTTGTPNDAATGPTPGAGGDQA